jgi:hypothetical protein
MQNVVDQKSHVANHDGSLASLVSSNCLTIQEMQEKTFEHGDWSCNGDKADTVSGFSSRDLYEERRKSRRRISV